MPSERAGERDGVAVRFGRRVMGWLDAIPRTHPLHGTLPTAAVGVAVAGAGKWKSRKVDIIIIFLQAVVVVATSVRTGWLAGWLVGRMPC